MKYEVKEELDRLKEMIVEQQIKTGEMYMFLDMHDYEDEYSGNEILDMQEELCYHCIEYLKENHSGKYAIRVGGYAVVVITKEHFDNIGWKYGWGFVSVEILKEGSA